MFNQSPPIDKPPNWGIFGAGNAEKPEKFTFSFINGTTHIICAGKWLKIVVLLIDHQLRKRLGKLFESQSRIFIY